MDEFDEKANQEDWLTDISAFIERKKEEIELLKKLQVRISVSENEFTGGSVKLEDDFKTED